jgi:hypothetical protein
VSNRRTIRSDGSFRATVPLGEAVTIVPETTATGSTLVYGTDGRIHTVAPPGSHDDSILHTVRRWGSHLQFRPTDGLVPITILDVRYVANTRTGACLRITHED